MFCDLTGKKALITGASGGIGREIAISLHKQGATLALSSTTDITDLLSELKERVFLIKTNNLMSEDALELLFKQAEESLGQVDILVNNAGMTKDNLSIRMSKNDWDDIIALNLTTPFLLSKLALSKMMKRKSGRIINISSVVGHTGNFGQANYTASKGGLTALTKTLAKEFAQRGITINAVAPGFIETKMTKDLSEDVKAKILSAIPMGRMGTTKEVADTVTFLSSNEASYITGETIHINGGMFMA